MTSQEARTPHSVDPDIPDTEVIVVSSPAPVFVDSTGRRRRLLRRLSYAFGGLCMVYGGLVSVSLAGGPVSSSAVLPLPDLRDDDADQEATGRRPAPIPAPSVSAPAPQLFGTDVLPRRRAAADVARVAEPRPPAVPVPTSAPKTPVSPAPASAKPVESTAVPSVPESPAPSTTTPATDPPINVPPINVPPAPPVASSGGEGGGETLDGDADETVVAPAPRAQSAAEPADARTPHVESAADPEPSVAAEQTV